MPEYTPLVEPAEKFTSTASATITGGQVLIVSGNDTVAPIASASAAWVGVAAHDAASGERVTVLGPGIHDLAASGAIAAGARVIGAAAGAVATIAAETNYATVIGTALSAAANSKVKVLIR